MIRSWVMAFVSYLSIPIFILSTATLVYLLFEARGIDVSLFYALISISIFFLLGFCAAQLARAINTCLAMYRRTRSKLLARFTTLLPRINVSTPDSIRRAEIDKLEDIDRTTFFGGETAPETGLYVVLAEAGKRIRDFIELSEGNTFPKPQSGDYYQRATFENTASLNVRRVIVTT